MDDSHRRRALGIGPASGRLRFRRRRPCLPLCSLSLCRRRSGAGALPAGFVGHGLESQEDLTSAARGKMKRESIISAVTASGFLIFLADVRCSAADNDAPPPPGKLYEVG